MPLAGAPLSADPAPSPHRPPASPWNVPQHPGIAWGSESPSWQPPEEILPSVSPFLCGRGRVASRRSAAEAPGRARAFGRPARWRPRRPATATRPRDVRVACREPPGGRLYIVPPLWSFGEASFRRIVTQPLGPRQSSQTPATLAATVPVAPRPRDSPAVAGDWFSRFLRRVTVAAHRSRLAGRPDRVDQHLPVPLRPRRRTARTLPGPGRRGGQGEGLPCPERLDSGSAVRTPPGPPSGACASPSAPLRRWGPARTVAWRSPEGAPGSGPSGPSCPRCFPRRAPEVGTRGLTGGGACAVPPWGPVARAVSRHPCFLFVKVLTGPETWMDRTLLPRVAGEGALDPPACPRGSRSSDATLAHPSPTP